MDTNDLVSVRIIVNDVAESVDFYVRHFGFEVLNQFPPFADVRRGNLRVLLSGPKSSAGMPMDDGEVPAPGGWNRIHFVVEDIHAEVARLESEGVRLRNPMVSGPGGSQILVVDPSGNLIELFEGAR